MAKKPRDAGLEERFEGSILREELAPDNPRLLALSGFSSKAPKESSDAKKLIKSIRIRFLKKTYLLATTMVVFREILFEPEISR